MNLTSQSDEGTRNPRRVFGAPKPAEPAEHISARRRDSSWGVSLVQPENCPLKNPS